MIVLSYNKESKIMHMLLKDNIPVMHLKLTEEVRDMLTSFTNATKDLPSALYFKASSNTSDFAKSNIADSGFEFKSTQPTVFKSFISALTSTVLELSDLKVESKSDKNYLDAFVDIEVIANGDSKLQHNFNVYTSRSTTTNVIYVYINKRNNAFTFTLNTDTKNIIDQLIFICDNYFTLEAYSHSITLSNNEKHLSYFNALLTALHKKLI